MSALGTSQEAMVLWRCSVHGMVSERSDECACARAERIEVAPVAELAAARKETERLRLTLDVERHERYAERGVAEREAVSLREALEAARLVAEYWRDGAMRSMKEDGDSLRVALTSHPCACILAALDGETDPVQLGVEPDSVQGKALLALRGAARDQQKGDDG